MKKTFLCTMLIVIAGTAIALMTDIHRGMYQLNDSKPEKVNINFRFSGKKTMINIGQKDTVDCKIECIEKFVEVPSASGKTSKIYALYKDSEANISDLIPVEKRVYEYIQTCKDNDIAPNLSIVVKNGMISSIIRKSFLPKNVISSSLIDNDTILITRHNGRKRYFVIYHNTCFGMCQIYVFGQKAEHTIKINIPDGYYSRLYTISPDRRYLYILGYVCANSNGWTVNYHLYKLDCESLKIKEIAKCAAIKKTKRGFMIAKCRITNEDTAKCTADEIWLIHDVNIDWNGRVISSDKKEYDYAEMERRYSPRLVKGFKKI
ncbi:MAG: hypothetical protein IJ624_04150 [Prevotella sp.]|nr:hypothetical protein [Prevotella sp.]